MAAFNLKPTVSAFLRLAYPFGLLEQPTIPSAMLNWNIQWAFPRRKHHNDHLQFDFYPSLTLQHWAALGILERREFTPELPRLLGEGILSETVVELLACGWYARMFVDYHYIEGTALWQAGHFRHDLMIFDQDPEKREFTGALYPTAEAFGFGTVAWDKLAEAVTSPHARGAGCSPYCRGNSLTGYRAGAEEKLCAPLHGGDIRAQLAGFLESSNLAAVPFATPGLRRFCRAEAGQRKNAAFGLAAYAEMRAYFSRAATGGVLPDRRVSRLVWEHKKLMKIRLHRLREQGVTLAPELLEQWEEIVALAHGIHLKVALARKRQAPAKLATIADLLAQLEERETEIIRRLVKAL